MVTKAHEHISAYYGLQPGDLRKLAEVVADIARGEGVTKGREVPVTVPLGANAYPAVKGALKRSGRFLAQWRDVIAYGSLLGGDV